MAFKFQKYLLPVSLIKFVLISGFAQAAGFSSSGSPLGGQSARALATNYSHLSAQSGRIKTRNYAKVRHNAINGDILNGYAEAGNNVVINIDPSRCGGCKDSKVTVDQKSIAKSKIHLKGKNILVKAYAKNHLKLRVDGQLYFENEEYAYAMGRFTPLGVQMRSGASSHNKLEAKGLVRLNTGQIVSVSGQVGK